MRELEISIGGEIWYADSKSYLDQKEIQIGRFNDNVFYDFKSWLEKSYVVKYINEQWFNWNQTRRIKFNDFMSVIITGDDKERTTLVAVLEDTNSFSQFDDFHEFERFYNKVCDMVKTMLEESLLTEEE